MSEAVLASPFIFDHRRPAAPVPPAHPPRGFGFIRSVRNNPIAAIGVRAYEQPILRIRNMLVDLCVVSDPVAIKRVLLDNVDNYRKGAQQQVRLKPALGNGLLTAEGASWRFQRRTAAPVFQHRRLVGFAGAMAAATNDMLARWEALPAASEVDVAGEMMRLTYDIITRTVFSNEVRADQQKMAAAIQIYFDTIGRGDIASILGLPDWIPTPTRRRAAPVLAFFRSELQQALAARRARIQADRDSAPDDLLTSLLTARDTDTGEGLSDSEVYDNVVTFIGAGHETTANAMAWTFYLLSEFPWAAEKLVNELRALPEDRDVTAADLPNLPYARMVLEESMRLYPPAPFIARQALAADRLSGVPVRKGTAVVISPWLLHRHRTLWREPELFMPERFAPERRDAIARFAYLPFGGGPRICIGMAFAMQEAMIMLATIARRWRLTLRPGYDVIPQASITLRPRGGLPMKLERR